MDKNLIGLIILGALTILFAIMMTFVCINGYTKNQSLSIQDILLIMATFGLLISGIFIFKRLEWARKLIIASYFYYIINSFIPLHHFIEAVKNFNIHALAIISIGLILFCANIYYFMRKDVRIKFVKTHITKQFTRTK